MSFSFLDIVNICDNFRVKESPEPLTPFLLTKDSTKAIGLLREPIVTALLEDNELNIAAGKLAPWTFLPRTTGEGLSGKPPAVTFSEHISTPIERSLAFKLLCEGWRDSGRFADVIGGRLWRNELYPIYIDPFGTHEATNYAFSIERAATSLFGVVTYGVHMTVYEGAPVDPETGLEPFGQIKIWVPKRASTKQTWPGYLDNSVAGGISDDLNVFDTIVKESMEEASIPEEVVKKYARAAGSISYFRKTSAGWLNPENEYVYDLRLPPGSGVKPTPLDGEVESFELLPLPDVITKMKQGLFKPNCTLVIIDFLIRHGYITPDTQPDFLEILTRLHGRFDYEMWY